MTTLLNQNDIYYLSPILGHQAEISLLKAEIDSLRAQLEALRHG